MQNKFPVTPQITYKSKELAYKSNIKFLGINTEETLKWTTYLTLGVPN
jgi:hypothetical protein